jgi:hypothetical protein
MARFGKDFGRTASVAVAETATPALADRESAVRVIGELLAFGGLLFVLASLFSWRLISGFGFIQNGWIDLPPRAEAAWTFSKPLISHVIPSENRFEPHGGVLFALILGFVAFSALLRRRRVLVYAILAFCLAPWAALGLTIRGVGFAASLILIAGLLSSLRAGDRRGLGIHAVACLAVWAYFSLDMMSPVKHEERAAVRFVVASTPGAMKSMPAIKPSDPNGLRSVAELPWQGAMSGYKAYLQAQGAFFRGQPQEIAQLLPAARKALVGDAYAGIRMDGLENYVLSEGIGAASRIAAYQSRRTAYSILSCFLLGLGAFAIVAGLSLEWMAALIKKRLTRIDRLARSLKPSERPDVQSPVAKNTAVERVGAVGLRSLDRRILWAAVTAALLLMAAGAVSLFAYILQPPSADSNHGFDMVHILQSGMRRFSDLGVAKTALHGSPRLPWEQWLLYLAPPLLIVLAAFRRFRLLRLALVVVGFCGFLAVYMFPRSGAVEIPIRDIKAHSLQAYVSDPGPAIAAGASDGGEAKAYHYALAQMAYLDGKVVETARQIALVWPLGEWDYPSVQWRMAIMQEWVEAHGGALAAPGERVTTTRLEQARRFAGLVWRAAAALALLSAPAVILLGLYLWRRGRVTRLVEDHGALGLRERRISQART